MAKTKVHTDRLLKLAAFLETVPRKAFDIGPWEARPATKPEGDVPGDCGFAGCAVGWAAHAKLFRGFTIKHHEPSYTLEKGRVSGWRAVREVFKLDGAAPISNPTPGGLPLDPGVWLFTSRYYGEFRYSPTPKQVAKRIRKYVKDLLA